MEVAKLIKNLLVNGQLWMMFHTRSTSYGMWLYGNERMF